MIDKKRSLPGLLLKNLKLSDYINSETPLSAIYPYYGDLT